MDTNLYNLWENYNRSINQWAKTTHGFLSNNLKRSISKNATGKLSASLRYATKLDNGKVDRASFTFNKEGIWIEKGVGGVYKVTPEGSGIVKRTTPGAINRHPKHWLKDSIAVSTNLLTGIVSSEMAKVSSQTIADSINTTGIR